VKTATPPLGITLHFNAHEPVHACDYSKSVLVLLSLSARNPNYFSRRIIFDYAPEFSSSRKSRATSNFLDLLTILRSVIAPVANFEISYGGSAVGRARIPGEGAKRRLEGVDL